MTPEEREEIELLVSILPERVAEPLRARGFDGLIEVILDLGRRPTARYRDGEVDLDDVEVKDTEIAQVVAQVSEFGDDNRGGIPRTLHRISAIRNRRGHIVGLTCRVGRSVSGSGQVMRDLIEGGHSILLLGPPGVGKTTMLRDVARMCADELGKRVVIVDTSNEIGGDGDIPHHGIGRARRMQVPRAALQHEVMIEAVENHTPEVVVIDEIGTAAEAEAARTIAERGVQLIGTAHGTSLSNLMQNPTLSDLIGGIESVTLSDEEARRRGTQKTVLERRAPPTFDVLVEIQSFRTLAIHEDVAATVDALLRGYEVEAEIRVANDDGEVTKVERVPLRTQPEEPLEARPEPTRTREVQAAPGGPEKRILPFGISRGRLEQAIHETRSAARIVDSVREADAVLTLRPYYRRRTGPLKQAEEKGIPIYVLRNNSAQQIERQLLAFRGEGGREDPTTLALREAEDAVAEITFRGAASVELSPATAYIRRLQHELVSRHGLRSVSKGREPFRRVSVVRESATPNRGLPWRDDDDA
ncbi:MAG: AAA family ATPase [Dehalococcoidia bacterium]|nr:AAA family ATPase [Dehalococcoidia bacterium]MCA9849139.1 AAA family ATPase [Dehalococcoidia bacterium]MCB9482448.1 AAA family ATPase [Dehalococcoidia bacterium]MCB9491267.1 AAA family ATPase [Dehalococcoidia bacterium]